MQNTIDCKPKMVDVYVRIDNPDHVNYATQKVIRNPVASAVMHGVQVSDKIPSSMSDSRVRYKFNSVFTCDANSERHTKLRENITALTNPYSPGDKDVCSMLRTLYNYIDTEGIIFYNNVSYSIHVVIRFFNGESATLLKQQSRCARR